MQARRELAARSENRAGRERKRRGAAVKESKESAAFALFLETRSECIAQLERVAQRLFRLARRRTRRDLRDVVKDHRIFVEIDIQRIVAVLELLQLLERDHVAGKTLGLRRLRDCECGNEQTENGQQRTPAYDEHGALLVDR